MTYKFTKSDEGKFLLSPFWIKDNYCETYNYIIEVSQKAVAYRSFFWVQGLKGDFIRRHSNIHCWRYGLVKADNNDLPDSAVYSYPLRLVVLGCPHLLERDLTEEERQKMIEFEQGKDISQWLRSYNGLVN